MTSPVGEKEGRAHGKKQVPLGWTTCMSASFEPILVPR